MGSLLPCLVPGLGWPKAGLSWSCRLEHLSLPLQHGGLRIVSLPTWWPRTPRVSVAREPGRNCMAFYALFLEVTSSKLYRSKQAPVCSDLWGGDTVAKAEWEKSQTTGDRA